jgi:uncharacterized membrane protein
MTDPILEPGNDNASMAKLVYLLYIAGILIGLTGIIGVVIAYVNANESAEWQKSHFQFQIRTFWIGLIYIVVGAVLSLILVGYLVFLFWIVWLIIRCVKGFQLVDKKLPHPNPTGWLF